MCLARKMRLFFLLSIIVEVASLSDTKWFEECSKPVVCGELDFGVGFPFWGGVHSTPRECGYPELEIRCKKNRTATIVLNEVNFVLLHVAPFERIITIVRADYNFGMCLKNYVNTSLKLERFEYAPMTTNITALYGCKNGMVDGEFTCKVDGVNETTGYHQHGLVDPVERRCNLGVVVQIFKHLELRIPSLGVGRVVKRGFDVRYKLDNHDGIFCKVCGSKRGRCGYNLRKNVTVCLCSYGLAKETDDGICKDNSSTVTGGKKSKLFIIALLVGCGTGGGIVAVSLMVVIVLIKKKWFSNDEPVENPPPPQQPVENPPPPPQELDIELIHRRKVVDKNVSKYESYYPGVKVFSYEELEAATQNFSETRVLGAGGSGIVYHGQLYDGVEVAVKRFAEKDEANMIELNILSRLKHKNLVKLLGCTSIKSEVDVLVLEFVPNGTLRDHLHGTSKPKLTWYQRLRIAIQTTEAICFLHENEVIHRDIKPSNILLDDNLEVKVADLGIAKWFPKDETQLITNAKGTIGYVDMVYYRRSSLTEKSDVYSMGMVLLELLSSKKAIDSSRGDTNLNLMEMAVNKLEKGMTHEIIDTALEYSNDRNIALSMDATLKLSLTCMDTERSKRPSMFELMGSLLKIQKQLQHNHSEASTSGQ